MSYEERKKYLKNILKSMGVVFFILLLSGFTSEKLIEEYTMIELFFVGIFGAIILGGMGMHMFFLLKKLFDKKTMKVKMILILFFPILFQMAGIISAVSFFPYQIYNIIKILKSRQNY